MKPPLTLILLLAASLARAAAPATRDVKWISMPIRSELQSQRGMAGGEGGQCLHGIARCASDDARIYLAVDVVGIWRSDDAGATWRPCKMDGYRTLGTTSIAVNPRNADDLLVYADSPDFDKPRQPEEGLYRSTDGGQTFSRVVQVSNDDPRRGFRRLIDYSPDGRRVYFLSFSKGLFRSDDSGATWTNMPGLANTNATEIRVDPRYPDTLWAATDDGLQLSRDGGKTFSILNSDQASAICLDTNAIYSIRPGHGLFQSTDDGKSFASLSTGDTTLDKEAQAIFQSPADPKRFLVCSFKQASLTEDGGKTFAASKLDMGASFVQQAPWGFSEGIAWSFKDPRRTVGAISCAIYGSEDGGRTFSDCGTGYTGFHHGWSNAAVAFAPDDPNRFAFFCYDYALMLSSDGGRTFANGRLKQKVQDWWGMYVGDMSPDWSKSPIVIASAGFYTRQQLVRSTNAGQTWTPIDKTEGVYFFVRFHPQNPNIVYADNLRSDDAGQTFKKLDHPIYAFAPSRPDTVYGYADGKVWRSDDRGQTWAALPAPPSPARLEQNRCTLAVDPTNPDIVWAMTPPDCAVFDGKSWRTIPASSWLDPAAHAFVNRIAIDPDNPRRIILGLDAIGSGYLFLSDDAGQTWQDITGNLPRLGPAQSLNIQPKTGRIFVGGGFGTWTTIFNIPRSSAPPRGTTGE